MTPDRPSRRVRARVTRLGRMRARVILDPDELPPAPGGLTFARLDESLRQVEEHAYELPVAHWPGLDEQMVLSWRPVNFRRPTRCGMFDITALLAGRRELISCEACRELVAADDAVIKEGDDE